MTYSFLGWCLEVICKLISDHKFINRGFLIGPYCPIYGWGTLLMQLLLQKYLNDPLVLFIMIILLCSISVSYTHLDVYKRQDKILITNQTMLFFHYPKAQ